MKRLKDVDMSKYTTFRAGGRAAELVLIDNEEELVQVTRVVRQSGREFMMMGNGSNLLFTDGGYQGIVLKLQGDFCTMHVEDDRLIVGSGVLMSQVASRALAEGLTGFEFASGIPGSIGGALFMNAGAYGGEMKDIVASARVMRKDLTIAEIPAEEMELGYRHSNFQEDDGVVLSVTLQLAKGDPETIAAHMKELAGKRNAKQPVQYPSAGSFFKRPEGFFAGKLIQDAGLKGVSVGGAQVSPLHSGFVINTGGATATDIITLMHLVQETVYDRFQVRLEPEVRIIGD